MSFWTCFFIIVGVLFLTAQLVRLIDFIERPAVKTVSRTAGAYVSQRTYTASRRSPRPRRAA